MADHGRHEGHVEILLATYNGESYLADQIDSLLRQTESGWHLTIRDDRSTDRSYDIALEYAQRHPERITAQQRADNSGSAKVNFLEMLAESRAPYVMLCDQDDVWVPDKVALTLARMRAMEGRFGKEVPLLVHTDLSVVGADLRLVEPSLMHAQQLVGDESRLARVVAQNMVTGCTAMANRALADLVAPPFGAVVMHDWWLALIAAAFGRIGFVDTATVLYRQHGANAVGARRSRGPGYKIGRLLDRRGVTLALRDSVVQAQVFLDRFGTRLGPGEVEMLRAFASLPQLDKWRRIQVLRRYGLWKSTLARRAGQLLFV